MKITNVHIENFLSIGDADFALDGIGLVHVSGINKDETSADSNGSGKSSLGDAISWCLWGSTARGVSGDEVVNTAAGKGAAVILSIDDDGESWRIERYRKYPKHKNGLFLFKLNDAGEWDDLTKGTSTQTQKAIERLMGCSEEVFNAAVYSGQEMMPDIPRMTDRQLKLLVEQAAGVDVLANAYDIARERMRGCAEKRAQAQIAFDRATERHRDATTQIERLSDEQKRWDANQAAKVARLKAETNAAVGEFKKAQEDLAGADVEKQLTDDIAASQAKIAAVSAEQDRERVLAQDVSSAQQSLAAVQRRVSSDEATLAAAERSVAAKEAGVAQVKNGVGKPCGSCGRPLEDEHLADAVTRAQAALDAQIADREKCNAALVASKGKLAAFEKALTVAQQALDAHRTSMTDVSAEATQLRNLQRELQILNASKAEVERLRTRARQVADQWKAETGAVNPFKAMIERAEQEVIERAAEIEASKAVAIAATEEEQYAQAVVEVFAPAGVRAHRLDEATPFLNERTAHYLGSLADGAIDAYWTTLTEKKSGNGALQEKFSVTVEKAGSAPSFNALSGGEKRKVRLACALALQDLVATRAAKNIELWIGDEIDDALDGAGLERLMGVLEEKARERGTVLVISHNDIAAYARKSILVEKVNGRATVTVQ